MTDCTWSAHWANCTASRRQGSQPAVIVLDHGTCTVYCRTVAKHTVEFLLAMFLFLSNIRFCLMVPLGTSLASSIYSVFLEVSIRFFGGKDSLGVAQPAKPASLHREDAGSDPAQPVSALESCRLESSEARRISNDEGDSDSLLLVSHLSNSPGRGGNKSVEMMSAIRRGGEEGDTLRAGIFLPLAFRLRYLRAVVNGRRNRGHW